MPAFGQPRLRSGQTTARASTTRTCAAATPRRCARSATAPADERLERRVDVHGRNAGRGERRGRPAAQTPSVSPTTTLRRLAMRECRRGAAAAPAPLAQINGGRGSFSFRVFNARPPPPTPPSAWSAGRSVATAGGLRRTARLATPPRPSPRSPGQSPRAGRSPSAPRRSRPRAGSCTGPPCRSGARSRRRDLRACTRCRRRVVGLAVVARRGQHRDRGGRVVGA